MASHIKLLNNCHIQLSYQPDYQYHVPNDMKKDYEYAIHQWKDKVKFNGNRAKPIKFNLTENRLYLDACPFDYVSTRALQTCLSEPQYQHYIGLNQEMSSVSLTLSLFSHEGYLLNVLRSPMLSKYPNTWHIGLGEGLEDKDFISGNLHYSVERCLLEELSLIIEQPIIEVTHFLSTHFETTTGGINIFGVVDLTGLGEQYSSDNILNSATQAHDAWEHEKMLFLPLEQSLYQQSTIPDISSYFSLLKMYQFDICK